VTIELDQMHVEDMHRLRAYLSEHYGLGAPWNPPERSEPIFNPESIDQTIDGVIQSSMDKHP
jgi:hypothetical protein